MAIMASYCFFIHMNIKKIQTKNPFDEILSLSFNLRPLKMNNNTSNKSKFCKGLPKGLI
jgi:hypothetical protein